MKRSMLCVAFVALAVAAFAVEGCGNDNNTTAIRRGGLGESCTRTDDCNTGLVCFSNYCAASTSNPTPDGGDTDSGTTPPPPGPRLGQRGDSCTVPADCADGLTCRPISSSQATGVCDLARAPFQPTGKTCTGECNMAADCCELPVGYKGYASCEAVARAITGTSGATPAAVATACATSTMTECFVYATYCSCSPNPWACTNNQCVYGGTCQFGSVTPKGCPDRTRTNRAIGTNCDTAAGKCQPTVTATGCTAPAMCDGQAISDIPAQTCNTGECTCFQSACYRRCTKDLDCAHGYNCDTGSAVCVPAPECTTNAYCADKLNSAQAECKNGKCVIDCKTDYDCNPDGLFSDFNSLVCNTTSGACEPVGCASDADCPGTTPDNVKVFCVTPPSGAATVVARSAITDGR